MSAQRDRAVLSGLGSVLMRTSVLLLALGRNAFNLSYDYEDRHYAIV